MVRESGMTLEQFAALFVSMKGVPLPVIQSNGVPAKSQDFVGRGGVTERADSGRLRSEELSEVHDDDVENLPMRKIKPLVCLLAVMLCMAAFSVTAFAGGGNYYEEEPLPDAEEPAIEEGEPLSEGTEFFTRDLLYDKHTNKQFITVQDRDGNLFYLVIDYDAPVNEGNRQIIHVYPI